MKFNWKVAAKIANEVAKIAVPAIGQVEERALQVKHLRGDAKKAAALALVREGVKAAEDISGKDLVNDPEFDAVVGDLNDVLVRLHNVAAKRAPAAVAAASAESLGHPYGSTGE